MGFCSGIMYRDGYTLGTSLFLIAKNLDFIGVLIGGASRDRTDDLIVANDALSQLSYSPIRREVTFFDITSRRSISPIQVIL
jgi:hypothetical protein